MTSIYNIGCFVGAMSTIITGDMLGRPRQIMLGSAVIAIGAVIQTAAYGVPQMMVGRKLPSLQPQTMYELMYVRTQALSLASEQG
jgi:MFS family permease